VEVLDRQQLQLSGIDPGTALTAAALGAVAVATGAVADLDVAAALAFVHVSTQGGSTAFFNGLHGRELRTAEIVLGAVVAAVFVEDVRDLEAGRGEIRREFPFDLLFQEALCIHVPTVYAEA
jgi:hypothetical protein